MKKIKMQYGITLVALIITIIVLLILSAVTIRTVTGGNGIIEQAKRAKTEYERTAEEENALLANLAKDIIVQSGAKPTWTQNGITVTDGTTTLTVGTTVSNFTAGGYTWKVFGAENGKLLLMTQENVAENTEYTIPIEITDGDKIDWGANVEFVWSKLGEQLNNACMSAVGESGSQVIEIRCPEVEDINRITGFVPEYGKDYGSYGYGTKVAYGWSVYYNTAGERLPNGVTAGSVIGVSGLDRYLTWEEVNTTWPDTFEGGGYARIKNNAYVYSIGDYMSNISVSGSVEEKAYNFIAGNDGKHYTLNSTGVEPYSDRRPVFALRWVGYGSVGYNGYEATYQEGTELETTNGRSVWLRAVAVMSSDFTPEV